jgi:perosamine synthetase
MDSNYTNSKNPFGKYNGNEVEYVLRALDSETVENGGFPWVTEFEDKFCELSGAKYSIAVNSATSGLHAALVAAGVGPGDEVIQPGLTVVMNAFVTLEVGAVPVFADINPATWNIDVETIRSKITSKTKAIMGVSLFGLPLDIDPIMTLAKENDLIVIDDSAETICGSYKGRFAGTHADIGVYSFENKKHMSSGSEGGMVITSNSSIAEKVRKFAGIGYKNLTASAGRTSLASSEFQNPNYQRHDVLGLNYRMNVVSAAVGLAQLERIEHLVQRRICIGEMFNRAIEGCAWLEPQSKMDTANHTYYTWGVLYDGERVKNISWEDFYTRYAKLGGNGFYAAWVNPYLEPALRGKRSGAVEFEPGLCPIAEDYQKKIMLFKTNYRNLSEARRDVKYLGELISSIGP